MKVTLLYESGCSEWLWGCNGYTDNDCSELELSAYLAGKNCTGKFDQAEVSDSREIRKFLNLNVNKLEHDSLLEHYNWTFRVENVSRALTHQLVRHRIGVSFAQTSQRYTEVFSGFAPMDNLIIPSAIKKNPEALEIFADCMVQVRSAYRVLRDMGIKKEDARAVSPQCHETDIIVSFNGRSMKNFLKLRLWGKGVQSEINLLAREFYNIIKKDGNFFDKENC